MHLARVRSARRLLPVTDSYDSGKLITRARGRLVVNLAVTGMILAVTTAASLIKSRRDPAARAHAGTVM